MHIETRRYLSNCMMTYGIVPVDGEGHPYLCFIWNYALQESGERGTMDEWATGRKDGFNMLSEGESTCCWRRRTTKLRNIKRLFWIASKCWYPEPDEGAFVPAHFTTIIICPKRNLNYPVAYVQSLCSGPSYVHFHLANMYKRMLQRHCQYQSFEYVHVDPAAQTVGPVHPIPPHYSTN